MIWVWATVWLAVNLTPHHSIRPLIDFNKIIECTVASRHIFFAWYITKLGALLPPAMAPASMLIPIPYIP
jgi:hypothetical protein